jgi:uncharacterized membrane protein
MNGDETQSAAAAGATADLLEAQAAGPNQRAVRLLRETGRVEAFSDGVFSIAATLLVLTLAVPAYEKIGTSASLMHALVDQWPSYFAFVVSFISILIMWVAHHNVFSLIKRVDHVFLLINGLVLLGITVTPFTTSLLADRLGHPGDRTAAFVFSGAALFVALAYNALWYWARRGGHLLEPDVSPQSLRAVTRQYAVAPAVYLVALGLSLWNAWASLAIFVGVIVFFAFPTAGSAPLEDEGSEPSGPEA